MQEFPGTIYEFSGKFHEAEAKEILDLIKACNQAFALVMLALETEDYPKPEVSRFIKMTDTLHIPTGPEPKVTKAMVTETLNKFRQWIEVLGDINADCYRDCVFRQECESAIEDYRIDTKYLTRKLRRLLNELRRVEEFANSDRTNRVQMSNPLQSTSRHKGKQAYIHEAFLNVQDVMYDLRRWGRRLEDGKQRRVEAIKRRYCQERGIAYKTPQPMERVI